MAGVSFQAKKQQEDDLDLEKFLLTGIDWRVAGLFFLSLFCLAVAGFSAAGFSQFVKKLWAYIRIKAHPGLKIGTWSEWPTSNGSFPVQLVEKTLDSMVLVGSGKTIYVPTLYFNNMPKVTIDQESLADEVSLTKAEYAKIMSVVKDLSPLGECNEQ